MDQIKLYLEKFKDWRPADAALKEALRVIIQRHWGELVDNDDIKLSGFTVYLKIKPILRGEILMHQEEIMAELADQIGPNGPKKVI